MTRRSYDADTIAAIATPSGRGGIGIVRVSGPALREFLAELVGKSPAPRVASVASVRGDDGALIDTGVVLYFSSPASFTGEDVIEFQGHGGQAVTQAVLARCVELGARLARPGEFTLRGFLNDKMDLAQAEAVADLIDATTSAAVRSAMRSLSGEFSRRIHALVEQLIDMRTLIEATLDFPEDEIDVLRDTDAQHRLSSIQCALNAILLQANQGALLRNGLHVVLTGLPNVGKSSLLNRLAGCERAIVTEIAGTTRDVLRESIHIEGIPVHIIDTAGLRDSDDVIEQLGVARAWEEVQRADVVLQLVDARTGETPADHAIAGRLSAQVERIVVENKTDLAGLPAGRCDQEGQVRIRLSAKNGEGLDYLRAELLRVVGWQGESGDVVLARERHLVALREAHDRLRDAQDSLQHVELCAEELRLAQQALGQITGDFTPDDLLGRIFSSFCIGK